jgi:hypothetical protein
MSDVGVWERKGSYELLVDQESAVQSDSDPQDCFPINEDHSDMVKFSDDSPEYRIVVRYLNTILHTVPSDSPMESEQFNQANDEGSSRPRQSKAPEVFDHRHGAFIADSSRAFFKRNPILRSTHMLNSTRASTASPIKFEEVLQEKRSETRRKH